MDLAIFLSLLFSLLKLAHLLQWSWLAVFSPVLLVLCVITLQISIAALQGITSSINWQNLTLLNLLKPVTTVRPPVAKFGHMKDPVIFSLKDLVQRIHPQQLHQILAPNMVRAARTNHEEDSFLPAKIEYIDATSAHLVWSSVSQIQAPLENFKIAIEHAELEALQAPSQICPKTKQVKPAKFDPFEL